MLKKKVKKIIADLHSEIDELKRISLRQSEQIDCLRKSLEAATMISDGSGENTQSYGKVIFDELSALKSKLDDLTAVGKSDVLPQEENQFSLQELKSELLKLVELITV